MTRRSVALSLCLMLALAAPLLATSNLGTFSASGVTLSGLLKALTFESTVATGTAPLVVASTTKVSNLNADTLDGTDSTGFATTLASVLALGNLTGGANVRFSSGDEAAFVGSGTVMTEDPATALTIQTGSAAIRVVPGTAGLQVWHTTQAAADNLALGHTSADAFLNAASGNLRSEATALVVTNQAGTGSGLIQPHASGVLIEFQGLARDYEAFTASDTLTIGESGKLCSNVGASGIVTLTSPAVPVEGMVITLVRVAGFAFRFVPAAGDNVEYSNGSMANGEYIECGATGARWQGVYDATNTAWITTIEFSTLNEETP